MKIRVGVFLHVSRQAVDPAQAPFPRQAGDGNQEIEGLVPQWRGPRLGDGRVLLEERLVTNEARRSPSTTSPRGLEGDRLQQLAVRLEPGEFISRRLSGPAGLASTDGTAIGSTRGRKHTISPL